MPDSRVCHTRKEQNRPSRIDDSNETESSTVLLLRNVVDQTEILSVDLELIPDVMRTGTTSFTQEHVRQTNAMLTSRGKTQIRNGQKCNRGTVWNMKRSLAPPGHSRKDVTVENANFPLNSGVRFRVTDCTRTSPTYATRIFRNRNPTGKRY